MHREAKRLSGHIPNLMSFEAVTIIAQNQDFEKWKKIEKIKVIGQHVMAMLNCDTSIGFGIPCGKFTPKDRNPLFKRRYRTRITAWLPRHSSQLIS